MGICRRNIKRVQIVMNEKIREQMHGFCLLRKHVFGPEEE
jgi:hypothetical protein